jgi:hypothetical protein
MAEEDDNNRNNNPDRLLSEPPDLRNTNEGELMSDTMTNPPPVQVDLNSKDVLDVINSEIGVSTLLNRLKQSIASAKVCPF